LHRSDASEDASFEVASLADASVLVASVMVASVLVVHQVRMGWTDGRMEPKHCSSFPSEGEVAAEVVAGPEAAPIADIHLVLCRMLRSFQVLGLVAEHPYSWVLLEGSHCSLHSLQAFELAVVWEPNRNFLNRSHEE